MNRPERDLCANCDHWREEHYGGDGSWIGEEIPCAEYQGREAEPSRRKQKEKQLEKAAGIE